MQNLRSQTTTKRLVQLDFLRGVAILLVLGQHLRLAPGSLQPEQAGRLRPLAEFLDVFGWTGVDLFFVLSGFLISGLLFTELQKTGKLNIPRFIIRRGFKIWPQYYLLLAMSTLVFASSSHSGLYGACRYLLPWYLHVQNYHVPDHDPLASLSHTWTLAVEEHFYLMLPLLLAFLIRSEKRSQTRQAKPFATSGITLRWLPLVGGVVMLACLALRLWMRQYSWQPQTHYTPTHLRIDSLFFGVILSYAWHYHSLRLQSMLKRPALLLFVGVILISPLFTRFLMHPFAWTFGFSLLYLGYGCILLAAMATTLPEQKPNVLSNFFRSRFARTVAKIGFYSYPIYLFHMFPGKLPMAWLLQHLPALPATLTWLLSASIFLLAGTGVGMLTGKLMEVPMLALRDRLFPAYASLSLSSVGSQA